MHAAAHTELSSTDSSAADADPLPCSRQCIKPDRGDWEYLFRAVGGMRVRPSDAAPAPGAPAGALAPAGA